jgi:hypothetical protein
VQSFHCFFQNLFIFSGGTASAAGDYAALDAQIDGMMAAFGSGVWECRVCGLHCKKGDMRRHVEAKANRV